MSKVGTKTIENDVNSVIQLIDIGSTQKNFAWAYWVKAANNVHNIHVIKDQFMAS